MAATKSKLEKFLEDTVVFLGPDREILKDHALAPRDEREERVMREHKDPHQISRVRAKLDVMAEEAFDQLEQTGAAPGASVSSRVLSPVMSRIFLTCFDGAVTAKEPLICFKSLKQEIRTRMPDELR